jgi:hypothetical protein
MNELTPRQKASADRAWTPPTKLGKSCEFEGPGEAWVKSSQIKLAQLFTLYSQLQSGGYVDVPMTFYNVMDFIGADSLNLDFSSKVFLYLIALVVGQNGKRYVIMIHCCLLFTPKLPTPFVFHGMSFASVLCY